MIILFLFLGIVAFAYFLKCLFYAGPQISFLFIWPLMAFAFFGLATIMYFEKRGLINLHIYIKRAVFLVVSFAFILLAFLELFIASSFKDNYKSEDVDYIIVLGCQVKGTRPSKMLKYRLDKCLELANESNAKIIVSGAKGVGEDITEAKAMSDYLVANGISEDRIIKEDRSYDTSENLKNSYALIPNKENIKVLIVTSNFHEFRASKIAKRVGFTTVYREGAKSDNVLFIHFMFREAIGIFKDFLMGNM